MGWRICLERFAAHRDRQCGPPGRPPERRAHHSQGSGGDGGRRYDGWWIGNDPSFDYQITSNTCQLLTRGDASLWSGELVYFGGDGNNDNGCTGPNTYFTASGHTCDDGGGGITTNNQWPRNASDSLWGYNCISSYHRNGSGAYKQSPIPSQGLYAYYVR